MFGFQRVGDFIWAAGDMRARGFLIGATAGRTTLEGEGLQHQDGHSLLAASTVPNCRAYDPAFGYEMAVIIQHGLYEMFEEEKDVFYYLMAMNEKYVQPPMPSGVEIGIIKGMYLYQKGDSQKTDFQENSQKRDSQKKGNSQKDSQRKHFQKEDSQREESSQKEDASHIKVQLLGSGAILNEVIAAAELLINDFDISADIWSVTSFVELRREALNLQREQLFALEKGIKLSYVQQCLQDTSGPIIAATDYVRAYADLIRPFVPRSYTVLGTDGYGRSDTRAKLRHFFEVDRYHIVVAALYALAKEDTIPRSQVTAALKKYNIDPNKPNPVTV